MKLQVLCINNDLVVEKTDLQVGKNIIGRGEATGYKNHRIAKNAVTINLFPNNDMTITPYQISPCYMKSSGSSHWQLLKLGTTVPIKPGDICSLLTDKCWFKVISAPNTTQNLHQHTSKRKANEDPDFGLLDKKSCLESKGEGDQLILASNQMYDNEATHVTSNNEDPIINNATMNEDVHAAVSEPVEVMNITNIEPTTTDSQKNMDEFCTSEKHDYQLQDQNRDLTMKENKSKSEHRYDSVVEIQNIQSSSSEAMHSEPSVSSTAAASARIKCIYGKKCYRKNSYHKRVYSHPEDFDYVIAIDQKECPYGTKCYRKNAQHKAEYKHTKKVQQPPKRKPSPDTSSITNELSADDDLSFEESLDESDYEPFSETESSEDDENIDE